MALTDILAVIALSMLPISELRGAIPYGLARSQLPAVGIFLLAVVANALVIPIVFFFLDYVHKHVLIIPLYRRLFEMFIERTRRKAQGVISKYGYLGLTLFVALPLPVTGAYTGTLAAWLFGMERKRAMVSLAVGVLLAGLIVTAISLGGLSLVKWFSA